tara:strand:- start:332 stop:526 length:195 start_codon:yes stop_codon:yes gene_type:complete
MATLISTVSVDTSEGASLVFGVKHSIVVLLIYVAAEEPNLPNLHFIPYCSNASPVAGGAAIILT